jgi:hypothetical protein
VQIINLNEREASTLNARNFYREYMGLSPEEATRTALEEHVGRPSKKFVEWLSDGKLTVVDGEVTEAVETSKSA